MLTAFVSTVAFAALASASPAKRAPAVDDTTVLNYALTLEHLESAFYSQALAKYSESDFTNAGLPSTARARFAQVAAHEVAHVDFLSAALGSSATAACEYSFPYTDPVSFAALAQTLEGVGVSAYTGAAALITTDAYLTAAASVLATEARHAGWVANAVNKQAPWSGALDVPLGLNEVYTLAAQFITSCPSSNPALPVKAYPSLTLGTGAPGSSVAVTYNASLTNASPLYVAFYTGLGQEFAEIQNGNVTIPTGLVGTVYAVLTSNGTAVTGNNTIAGVAVLAVADNVTATETSSASASSNTTNGAVSLRSGAAVVTALLAAVVALVL